MKAMTAEKFRAALAEDQRIREEWNESVIFCSPKIGDIIRGAWDEVLAIKSAEENKNLPPTESFR